MRMVASLFAQRVSAVSTQTRARRAYLGLPLRKRTSIDCFKIRRARYDDVDGIYVIEKRNDGLSAGWTKDQIAEELERERAQVFVSDDGSGLVTGWVVAWTIPPDELHIMEVGVLPEYNRTGIGTALLQTILNTPEMSHAFLEVRRDNGHAIKFYEKLGFQGIGIRKGLYSDGQDGLVMQLTLSAGR